MRDANSVDTVAGEHEMRVAVDEPGQHTPSVGVDALVGGRRAARCRRRRPMRRRYTTWASVSVPSAPASPSPQFAASFVTSSADAVEHERS